jgi:hypothetical protein
MATTCYLQDVLLFIILMGIVVYAYGYLAASLMLRHRQARRCRQAERDRALHWAGYVYGDHLLPPPTGLKGDRSRATWGVIVRFRGK